MRMGTPIETRIEERKVPETIFGDLHTPDGRCPLFHAYRYQLYRSECCPLFDDNPKSEKTLCFVMLNPSTADATKDDPTIRQCRGYAKRWGYQHLYVVNLFAFRHPDPKKLSELYCSGVDIVGPENDEYIFGVAEESDMVIAAWGAVPRALEWRAAHIREIFRKKYHSKVRALGLTKKGAHPRHPLYMKKNAEPFSFLVRR